jgi:hypothetical protein
MFNCLLLNSRNGWCTTTMILNLVGTLFTLWPWPPGAEAADMISNMSASFIFMWC